MAGAGGVVPSEQSNSSTRDLDTVILVAGREEKDDPLSAPSPDNTAASDESQLRPHDDNDNAGDTQHGDTEVAPELTRPHSLVAQTSDHSIRDEHLTKCCSDFYDIFTILISIADIATDIMVLISYFNNDRMTFFWISFTILMTAQVGYVFIFWINFDFSSFQCIDKMVDFVDDRLDIRALAGFCRLICYLFTFCILLPFAHFVAFLMYFVEDKESAFTQWLENDIGIKRESNIPLEDRMSERTRLAAQKMNKHSGFIMEAFLEALPQSILQLIAMVYFQETSIIAVGSIILSMTSIMTKSLVISQGLEWKSYIWCWLCVCTDFFSIFFIVSWLFLSNEHINGEFLGYFSVIGEVWCWKVMIAVLPFWVFLLLSYFFCAFWVALWGIWKENDSPFTKCFFYFVFLLCGNAFILCSLCVISLIGMLFMEIACFTVLAFNLWCWCTVDRWDYTDKHVAEIITVIYGFIGNASRTNNDRIIRICAVNYANSAVNADNDGANSSHNQLGQWILDQKKEKRLHQVTYRQLRDNSSKAKEANFFSRSFSEYCNLWKEGIAEFWGEIDWEEWDEVMFDFLPGFLAMIFAFVAIPMHLLSRIVSVLYPYFIVIYVSYNELWSEMNLFEVVMLGIYIGLQMMILFLGIFVYRTHKWLWHVLPGKDKELHKWPDEGDDLNPLLIKMYAFYDEVQWMPVAREIVLKSMGPDIGFIVMEYIEAMSEVDVVQEN